MDAGEITPAEYARLYPLASERELLIETVGHDLNLGSLFALAYADEYPLRLPTAETETAFPSQVALAGDANLIALAPEWQAARELYEQRSAECSELSLRVGGTGPGPAPSGSAHAQWREQVAEWRERTGVADAEQATDEALDALAEIEDRIAELPAASLSGLHLKARVAQRCDDIEVEWPQGLGGGIARDLLALGADGLADEDPAGDALLLQLGRQFEAARAREIAACEGCNAAGREAERHMPERPACLTLRASDAPLHVYPRIMMAAALEGIQLKSADIEWLRGRMPMVHEVLRPIREGERAHIDHPGRKFDIVPHPEAQARAEEIVGAWDTWWAEKIRVHGEYLTDALDEAANDAGSTVAALAEQIAALPARTAEGFRVKLRVLSHYSRNVLLSETTDEPDPDQLLSHSLWRDVQGEAPTVTPAEALTTTLLDLWPTWTARQGPDETEEESASYKELQESRYALIDAADDLPATLENIVPKALALAWLDYVDQWRAGWGRSDYTTDGRLAFDINKAASAGPAQSATRDLGVTQTVPSLVGMVDFAAVTISELRTIHEKMSNLSDVAYAMSSQGCCETNRIGSVFVDHNAAGNLLHRLGEALTDVQSAAAEEMQRRQPADLNDRCTRLAVIADRVIYNGDDTETAALIRDLAAFAAEQASR
jgi:hypothetical protein